MRERTIKRSSIARRLIVTVLSLELLSALGIIALALVYERHVHMRAFDVALQGHADSILGAVGDTDDVNDDVMLDWKQVNVPRDDIFEVVANGTQVLGRSANWREGLEVPEGDGPFHVEVGKKHFHFLREHIVRIVDPGDKDGGKRHALTVLYGSSTDQVWRQINETVWFYAGASSLLLIATGLVMALLLHRGMSPLRDLAAQAEGLSAKRWSFRAPESARATTELAPVALSMEAAVQRLERSFNQQEQFLSDAAHELKTAVALVKSSIQVMAMRPRSSEEYAVGLDRSLTDCERMEGIVSRMLTLARLDAATAEATGVHGDLTASAIEAVQQFDSMAELRRIELQITAPGPLWTGLAIEECSLICGNLLLNAIQHSPEETTVRFVLTEAMGWVEMQVEDQGNGIPPEALDHVFERFYRGDPSRNRETGGTGLGLAICKAVIEKASGTIQLESQVGLGTKVRIRVPKTSAPTA